MPIKDKDAKLKWFDLIDQDLYFNILELDRKDFRKKLKEGDVRASGALTLVLLLLLHLQTVKV